MRKPLRTINESSTFKEQTETFEEQQATNFQRKEVPTLHDAEKKVYSRRSLFKGIQGISRIDSSPKKKHLMKMVESKEDQIRKSKRLCRKRQNNIKSLQDLTDTNGVRNMFKGMSQTTADFVISQLKCAKRNPKGRRWTNEDKIMALAIYKRGPKCYNFLRKLVALPSRKTILAVLQKVPFSVEINFHLFKHLNQTLTKSGDRLCVLLFDEMDIKEHVLYQG